MLTYDLLRNHAGVMLKGDYGSLRALHEVVHDVNERSPLIKDKEGSFLGLAYDVRKAYEQQREVFQPPEFREEVGLRFGVQILWPVLLVQSRMLRTSMAFIDTGKWAQAVAYNLEAVIEAALVEDFGSAATEIKERWELIDGEHPWAEEKLNSRGAIFSSWGKAQRAKRMPALLASLDPMYPTLYPIWLDQGDKNLISPEELDSWDDAEWPDPKW